MSRGFNAKGSYLTAILADETTVTGFLLTGMGERRKISETKEQKNFMVVTKTTTDKECEILLRELLERRDIGIVMLSQDVAEKVKNVILEHQGELQPTILVIPAKGTPYDPEKDDIVVRAAQILWGSDTGLEKLKEIAGKNPAMK
jgi:ATP synthase F subunit